MDQAGHVNEVLEIRTSGAQVVWELAQAGRGRGWGGGPGGVVGGEGMVMMHAKEDVQSTKEKGSSVLPSARI